MPPKNRAYIIVVFVVHSGPVLSFASIYERVKSQKAVSAGFTLIELLVVTSILSLLAVIALPNLLRSRDHALITSRIGEAIAFANACSIYQNSRIGSPPTVSTGSLSDGVNGFCSQNASIITASWGVARSEGVICLKSATSSSDSRAVFTIDSTAANQVSCTLMP